MLRWEGSSKGVAAIVGVGTKLGYPIARKFAHYGYTVAMLSRDQEKLSGLALEIAEAENGHVFAIPIDCCQPRSITEAFDGVLSAGPVEVLVYNAFEPPVISSPSSSMRLPFIFLDIGVEAFQKSLAVSSLGAFLCAQKVLPGMVQRGRGTILFTGCSASVQGTPGYADLCSGKFALRGLSQSLAKEVGPHGIHVSHVIIHGVVAPANRVVKALEQNRAGVGTSARGEYQDQRMASSPPSSSESLSLSSVGDYSSAVGGERQVRYMDPDVAAETYWQLHLQNPAVWTPEMDLHA